MQKIWKPLLDGRKWSLGKIMSSILNERGIINQDRFLYPIEEDLLPLDSFLNIKQAADVVTSGIKNKNSFLVYFDSDTDGVTSGAIMTRYLRDHSVNPDVYINSGKQHGLRYEAPCFQKKYDIVIIVDSIETEPYLYEELLNLGTKIVVLDHHDLVPSTLAIQKRINLVSSMNEYENPHLCGAGVTLKFCLYLDYLFGTDYAQQYYDLASTGICADMMNVGPESMENRYICYRGFDKVNNLAIKKINGGYVMNSTAVAFGIAPLVNAANRMNKNWDALKLFLSDDEEEIDELIKSLKYCKEKQNDKVDEIFAQIKEQAKSQEDKKVMFFVIDNAEDSAGVSGLLANKVLGQYQRPVVITQETVDQSGEEVYSGSLRATGVEDFSKMVNKTRYAKAMGHSNAAGFIAKKKNIDKFKDKIEEELKDVEFKQYATVDIQLTQRQISKELINNLSALNRISGQGFQPISVMIEDIDDYEVGYMSGGKHTKITTPYMMFIKWNSDDWETIPDDASIAAIGTLEQGYIGRKFYYKMIMNDYRIDERIDLDDI